MKTLMSLRILHLVLATISLPFSKSTPMASNANLVDQTCKRTSYYNLCVSTLNSDKRSANSDVTGLALIMVDAMKAKATHTLGNIEAMLQRKPMLKEPLSSCAEKYSTILDVYIPEAIEALTKGDPKFAEDGANGCANESNSCEQEFKGGSPLTAMNKDLYETSAVVTAIIRILL